MSLKLYVGNENVIESKKVDLFLLVEDLVELLKHLKENLPGFSSVSNNLTEEDPLLTLSELAIKLKKSESTIHGWKRKGLIPFQRIGRSIYFSEKSVRDALKSIPIRESNKDSRRFSNPFQA